jgi:hypothetical protein
MYLIFSENNTLITNKKSIDNVIRYFKKDGPISTLTFSFINDTTIDLNVHRGEITEEFTLKIVE